MTFSINGRVESRYFCEETKNGSGKDQKFTFDFDSKYKIISHEKNPASATVKAGKTVVMVAKWVDPRTDFDWGIYERTMTPVY